MTLLELVLSITLFAVVAAQVMTVLIDVQQRSEAVGASMARSQMIGRSVLLIREVCLASQQVGVVDGALVAEHCSWRSPDGRRPSRVRFHLDARNVLWMQGDDVSRPIAQLEQDDGFITEGARLYLQVQERRWHLHGQVVPQ